LGISFATMVKDLPLAGTRPLAFIPMRHYVATDFLAVLLRRDKVMGAHLRAFLELLLAR
jgi:hypothetical protein